MFPGVRSTAMAACTAQVAAFLACRDPIKIATATTVTLREDSRMRAFSGAVTGFLIVACACEASAQEDAAPAVRDKPREEKEIESRTSSGSRVIPENEPYPMQAAGWGPAAGPFFVERWAEDWSRLRRDGEAPALKACLLYTSPSPRDS